jgi:ATP-dependent protease ClpP protease subunit
VDIRREHYAMASADGGDAEITMYGDIGREIPRDWQTGAPLEGQHISLEGFMEDLKRIEGAKRLTVRINSCGGDVFAAIPIHNRLRELKAEVTAIVDGAAMSGGSLIMCAADRVEANPSSLVMVHRCWSFMFGGFNADELRKVADSNDAVDRAQAAIYMRKTGLGEDEVMAMMADETYMTGREAVEKGFADALTGDEPARIAASADMRTLYVNGRARRLPFPLVGLPAHVPVADGGAEAAVDADKPAEAGRKGGNDMNGTAEEKKDEGAEAAAGAATEAAKAVAEERERLAGIDEVAHLFDAAAVKDAKYGEKTCDARELCHRAALKAAKEGRAFMADMLADSSDSGAAGVGAAAADAIEALAGAKEPDRMMADARALVRGLLGKKEKGE